jgi:hypothetical protein
MTAMRDVQLDYGHASRWRRRKIPVWLALFLLMLPCGIAAARYGRPWLEHRAYLRAQQRCLDYSALKDQLVFEQGPGVQNHPLPPRFQAVPYWSKGHKPVGGPIGFMPAAWEAVGGERPGIAFMHSRKTTSGIERLIIIAFSSMGDQRKSNYGDVSTNEYVGRPATSDLNSRIKWTEETTFCIFASRDEHLRVFAGEPDPQDPSRFTIPYALDGSRGVIEGKFVDPVLDRNVERFEPWCIELQVISGPLRDRRSTLP